ncbi:mRNA-capping enzyme subunit beta [Lachnellula hyalina]|uniref:mRNA-capping enzyme subunit beta n=1 Tax=Lachnellula hyalina TaxID=1316788 RepID=A0A8H8R479_9HELO|nr:mRNA-capping enzyme subunit beta [Lachnellula hyalina]TVY28277.1 mRNA-capping enzyme subunit beta [Lachnellula hyalina]
MDLRSIINTNEGGDSSVPKQAAPVTPIQAPPGQGFREFHHLPQASPGKHPSQDYTSQTGPYASPTAYQGAYQGRPPPPPPIQAPQNDLRSPARSYSVQSPYQHTPSSSSTNQYPFPQSQTPQSPAQQLQQYPPSFPQRESYPQSNPPHLQHHNPQSRGSPAPQTPPIGIPGAPHPYLQHQRSQSSISTGTPTSAQSQQPYYNPYRQESPVSTSHFPPTQIPQHQRQQSQPGTPLGPPLTQRHSSGGFVQPTSPYQQRSASSGPFNFQQTSPAPPPSASIPRQPSTPSAYDSQRTPTSEQRRSQSERERSISVSPKTRLPSQPSTNMATVTPQSENGYTNSTKRKLDEREMPVEQPRPSQYPDVKPPVNGESRTSQSHTVSPKPPAKKRMRYTEPPIWAQSIKTKTAFASKKRALANLNGKQPEPYPIATPVVKSEMNGNHQVSPAAPRQGTYDAPPDQTILLGPWEKSITGNPPMDQTTKKIADFLFTTVVSRNDLGELLSRGVEIEIEAKLGHLIDKQTNVRFEPNVRIETECVLAENPNLIAFRSSMTDAQHSTLNNFLNAQVAAAHPNNPDSKKRVSIDYLHRKETDTFYHLPPSWLPHLPAVIREYLKPHQPVKVRVTRDQKTGNVLAKIIKARIADMSIYNPQAPLDCRISVNFEMRYDGDIELLVPSPDAPERHKDRMSYTQGPYQIDLTLVTQIMAANGGNRTSKEHELEIELSTAAVSEQGRRAATNEPHEYPSLVEGFLNNVLVLAREAPPVPQ